jgi:DNA-binding HxlR family transcriptional regulator
MKTKLSSTATAGATALPRRGNCFAAGCASRAVLAHVTGRWGSLVIAAISAAGTLRFSQLRDRIEGISEKMLAQTLRELERDGLVLRTSRPVVPPHVDYELTALGRGVAGHIQALVTYLEANVTQFALARSEHDAACLGEFVMPQAPKR